jgi:two-component system KDP operon response regulator KdpE
MAIVSALHPKILIIDNDPQIHRYLRPAMISAGYGPHNIDSGVLGLQIVANYPPDAVVLDLDLADMDGKELLTQARKNFSGPILILSARKREIEKIEALDLGADDFVTKPFSAEELMARLRVAFRRRIVAAGGHPVVEAQHLSVDLINRTACIGGRGVSLSEQQYSLLARLAGAGGRVLTYQDLIGRNKEDPGYRSRQNVRLLIRQLRYKLEKNPQTPTIIKTQHGIGYRFLLTY